MRLIVSDVWGDRHHNVDSFAARDLWPALELFLLQQIAHSQCGIDDEVPFDTVARIEIEDQYIVWRTSLSGLRARYGKARLAILRQ